MKKPDNNFIMMPTIDFCFKELMMNTKVRTGFIASLLDPPPERIRDTEIVPTELPRDYPDDKLGILNVHVRMQDGTHMNLEMQVQFFEYWDSRILFYLNKFSSNCSARSAHLLRRPYENIAPVGIQPIAKRFLMAGCHNSSAG